MDEFLEVKSRAARFWSYVGQGTEDACWEWQRFSGAGSLGYGVFYLGKSRRVRAHRAAWMLANDAPIPDGMCVCHRCDNPKCCNPRHLWLGTDAENNRDRADKGRTVRPPRDETKVSYCRGEAHGCAKLSDNDVVAIARSILPARTLAGRYMVSESAIYRAKHRGSALIEQQAEKADDAA